MGVLVISDWLSVIGNFLCINNSFKLLIFYNNKQHNKLFLMMATVIDFDYNKFSVGLLKIVRCALYMMLPEITIRLQSQLAGSPLQSNLRLIKFCF